MKQSIMLLGLAMLLGSSASCGTAPAELPLPAPAELPEGWMEALQGPPGPPGDISLLSWARFWGTPPVEVATSGGPVGVASITRMSEGVYRIIYDVPTANVGLVVAIASGSGFVLSQGENTTAIVGVSQDLNASNLTLEVVSVFSIFDTSFIRLADSDALFNVVVFGNLPDD